MRWTRRTLDDIYVGCAEPRDEQGGNVARRIAVQLGLDNVSAATINRFCASSVQTARMAFHAIRSGEGHAFVSAGVECVSRYRGFGSAGVDPVDTHNPIFATAEQRSLDTALSNQIWHDPREDEYCQTSTLRWVRPPRTSPPCVASLVPSRTSSAYARQNLAEKAIANGIFDAEIAPVTLPDGTVVSTDDGPRPGTTMEAVSALKPAFRPNGTVTAGNCCPLNDGAAAVVIMSDRRAAELGLTPLARIVANGSQCPEPRNHGPRAGGGQSPSVGQRRYDDQRHGSR